MVIRNVDRIMQNAEAKRCNYIYQRRSFGASSYERFEGAACGANYRLDVSLMSLRSHYRHYTSVIPSYYRYHVPRASHLRLSRYRIDYGDRCDLRSSVRPFRGKRSILNDYSVFLMRCMIEIFIW